MSPGIYLLHMKNSEMPYYGNLEHPYVLFPHKDSADGYLHDHNLESLYTPREATSEAIKRYFTGSF